MSLNFPSADVFVLTIAPGMSEADIVLNYWSSVAIVQGSWDWPFAVKQMDVYGRTGYAKAMDSSRVEVRLKNEAAGKMKTGQPLAAPYDDPLHYLEAVLSGQVKERDSVRAEDKCDGDGDFGRGATIGADRQNYPATAGAIVRGALGEN